MSFIFNAMSPVHLYSFAFLKSKIFLQKQVQTTYFTIAFTISLSVHKFQLNPFLLRLVP